jgi:benzoyl-CoA reductase/2-hydroxyglutaryl-CoA dehydratase subunit BcrC/BadD/HgdB
MLDKLGLLVVEDEMVTGLRSIAKDAEVNGDPIEALVNRHFASTPYAGYHLEPAQIVEDFLKRVRESGARGVIFLNPKFCEAAGFDTPDLQSTEQAHIPSLSLDVIARRFPDSAVGLEAFRDDFRRGVLIVHCLAEIDMELTEP